MKNILLASLSIFIALGSVTAQAKSEQAEKAKSEQIEKSKAHKDKQLPKGLEKKLERDGELPPGWEKKLAVGEVMNEKVYRHAKVVEPVNDTGELTVEIEGKTVRMIEATREIIDILK